MSTDRERLDEIAKRIRNEINSDHAHLIIPNNNNNSELIINSTNNNNSMGRRPQSFGVPSGALNTITPCAACKLLRRRCAEECPFSPYFSPQEPQKFAAVHKVFGASNVSKMLMELPESQRADAANSLVYEANLRMRDPVYGCMGLISALQQQIQTLQAELNAIRTEILRHKYREATSQIVSSTNINTNITSTTSSGAHAALVSLHHHHHHGLVSVASLPAAQAAIIPPPSTPPAPPPQPPPLPPPSVVVSPSSTSSNSSLYTTPSTNTTGYSSISSDNVPSYFD
uniref:Lateral organ boundaries domain protein n=1 Tax=Boehmeria nivea TaxID=83906 RepID=A0A172J1X1_BOENI|nr:lateral organ boundaries domain protein [Boehmeria nivea]